MEERETAREFLSGVDRIAADVAALAGRLPHRGANTLEERRAAAYVLDRLRETDPETAPMPFPNVDSFGVLFAAYYAEFAVVTLIALWFPLAAFFYGLAVFGCYLAEFTGYSVFGRFLPSFEGENVVAYAPGADARKTIVVTAHYDTGRAGALYRLAAAGKLHVAHLAVTCAMFVIVLACLTEAVYAGPAGMAHWLPALRAGALGICLAAAGAILIAETAGGHVPGAVGNASGVAALLTLADRIKERPLGGADIFFVATGGKETWMRGMRHLLKTEKFDRRTTYFLNLAHVGAGSLAYTMGEGMLHVFPSSPPMLAAARQCAVSIPATAATLRSAPTDAAIPLARGYHAMTIAGLNERRSLAFWRSPEDTEPRVDAVKVRRAVDFAEGVLRRLDEQE